MENRLFVLLALEVARFKLQCPPHASLPVSFAARLQFITSTILLCRDCNLWRHHRQFLECRHTSLAARRVDRFAELAMSILRRRDRVLRQSTNPQLSRAAWAMSIVQNLDLRSLPGG